MKTLKELEAQKREALTVIADANKSIEERQSAELTCLALEREIAMIREEQKSTETKREKVTLTAQIRESMKAEDKTFTIRENKTATVGNIGANVVETEIQPVLEPLYARSIFGTLGVRSYTGVPMGNLSVPVMGKGNVGWAGEVDEAAESKNSWGNVTLTPKRLTAFVDISKQLILQENAGANEAIHRDIVNALKDKFEATVLADGDGSIGTGEQKKDGVAPKGLFNGKTLEDATTFAKLVEVESDIEDSNITGECKYVLSNKSKADLRTMPTNGNGSKRVMEGGSVDGTTAIATSNVAAGKFIYGDFSQLAVALWDGVEITVDPYTQATKGCIRLVINAYMDAAVLRPEAFVYGRTRTISE